MKRSIKTIMALLLAAALLFTAALPALAKTPDYQYENGYRFYVEQTDDGPVLREVVYWEPEGETSGVVFLPETLGGLPVTPEAVDGTTFMYCCCAVEVGASNPWFSTVNGALCSKDGKTLVCLPHPEEKSIVTVPEGVEAIGNAAVWGVGCAVIPDSVSVFPEGDDSLRYCVIGANTGTAAEAYANENGCKFVPLDRAHSHVYFRDSVIRAATCAEGGLVELACPCGAAIRTETQPVWHRFSPVYSEETGEEEYRCRYCGRTIGEIYGDPDEPDKPSPWECDCVCHKIGNTMPGGSTGGTALNFIRDFLYRLRIVFWRITGTNQYCECGERHY